MGTAVVQVATVLSWGGWVKGPSCKIIHDQLICYFRNKPDGITNSLVCLPLNQSEQSTAVEG